MDGKDKVTKVEITDRGPSGRENYTTKHDEVGRFWSALGKKIAHGPAVRIREGYDRSRGGSWKGASS